MFRFPSGVHNIGKCKHRTAITLEGAAVELTLTDGYNSIEVVPGPDEANDIYFGGSAVNAANGVPIGAGKIWNECKPGFSVYIFAASANVRIAEYA